ncbi:bifunctional DNA primase/polymerase [Novosphingobium sp. KCTC 2891]|uniref:bifunctional DNA primase/polymerase n=1 Tax=Novosphingobium sp. KCTC 2891 TaxID=2989730 RepID=UPI002222DB31|nr:bifunctional DNA primase/polymerase [Novosphingobium sp. KCTC 2891]MCW1381510.1 bifunctional DNA primase/polymerase [Novosphingobium sp. KCTC 2891]
MKAEFEELLCASANTSNRDVAMELARAGFAVFPICDWGDGDGLKPIKNWPERASTDASRVVSWWATWPDASVGLATGDRSGLAVLDVDTKKGKDGVATLAEMGFADLAALTPVRVRTPSGGWHLYFRNDDRLRNAVDLIRPGSGIDVRTTGGFVYAPGSLKNGRPYTVEGATLGSVTLPPFPEVLLQDDQPTAENEEAGEPLTFEPGELEQILAALPVDTIENRASWITIGQALHHQFSGGDEGFRLWMETSQRGANYLENSSEAKERRRYDRFGRTRRKPVTMATVRQWAREAELLRQLENLDDFDNLPETGDEFDSLLLPAAAAVDDLAAFDLTEDEKAAAAAPRKSRDPIIERMNRKHAVVAHHGRTLITTLQDDDSIAFGTMADLNTLYANVRRTFTTGKGDKATEKSEPVSAYWLRHEDRATYERLTFEPGITRKGALNLWRGWNVDPDPFASCALFLEHVRKVICRGNPDHAAYVFGWMAHLIQRPAEKPGVALVLRGAKGAGKDTLAEYLAAVIGRRHVPTVSHENHITGNFNKRLEAALLLHVQEGTWAGDHKAEGVLKYLVTSDFVEIERKGIDSFQLPSFLRLFISSNADWTVPASADERRWAVFNVSDVRCGDAEYFGRLRAEMKGSGPAALLAWLQAYDLSGFNVRKAPDTAGLLDQKLASLRNVEAWWHEVLCAGELPSSLCEADEWQHEGARILCDTLRRAYAEWMKQRRYDGETLSDQHFGRKLQAFCPEIKRARPNVPGRPRQYVIPTLETCRERFCEWIGGTVDWTG